MLVKTGGARILNQRKAHSQMEHLENFSAGRNIPGREPGAGSPAAGFYSIPARLIAR